MCQWTKEVTKEIWIQVKNPKTFSKLFLEVVIFGLLTAILFSAILSPLFEEKTDINVRCSEVQGMRITFSVENKANFGGNDFNLIIKDVWTNEKEFEKAPYLNELWGDKEKRDWYVGIKMDDWAQNNCVYNNTVITTYSWKNCTSDELCVSYTDFINKNQIPVIQIICKYIPPNTKFFISFYPTQPKDSFLIDYWGESTPYIKDEETSCKKQI